MLPGMVWYDDVVIPALLRGARTSYRRAIRSELAAAGLDDLPRNAPFLLGGLANRGGSVGELTGSLGVTRQAASQLVDTLVTRGYLTREPDPVDRRRMVVTLTERGRFAGERVRAGVEAVDAELAHRLAPDQVVALRRGLGALVELGRPDGAGPDGPPAPARFRRWAPIFPVRRVDAALAHYADLGFAVSPYSEGDEYGFADRDGTSLHLSRHADAGDGGHGDGDGDGDGGDHVHGGSAYLYVSDADALAREWGRPGVGGRTIEPRDTPYRLREGAHVDPDGNLIRFGSWLRD